MPLVTQDCSCHRAAVVDLGGARARRHLAEMASSRAQVQIDHLTVHTRLIEHAERDGNIERRTYEEVGEEDGMHA